MKKQNEVRYIVTDVVSIPVFRLASKTEAYRQAMKPGWGTVEWYSAADGYKNPVSRDCSDKTQQLVCDEDSSADLYTKNGGYSGISPYEEINTKEMPKQAECAAIIHSDSCGYDFWTEDGQIRIFVTYDANGLIDSYRLDLAQCMSLNIDRVWLKTPQGEILTPLSQIQTGDQVCVRLGGLIPLDGVITEGEVMVNQASLTGESIPVPKRTGMTVYAGTVVEEGECVLQVSGQSGSSRYDKIVAMIEQSESLKSTAESRAANLADRLVPYTLAGSLLTYLLTRNVSRALSVLMVDFSCALKLAMPLAVLSAMREASGFHVTVKGGKYLETVAQADTVVFDKTGTLTHACPVVAEVIPFGGQNEADMLRLAACLEEHFPHSMANAVVQAARERGLSHEEMHSEVEYIVAHGIVSEVNGRRVIIGSAHFVFEDEHCTIPEGEQERYDSLPDQYSHLYLAIGGVLSAVVCISDPLRPEAGAVIRQLRGLGIRRAVMLTGDSERTAAAIAAEVGVDEYHAEILPADKASFVEAERAKGHTVIMIGDGINDSPALSKANVGIAISDGAAIAREIADITIAADDLHELVSLRRIAGKLTVRIRSNYRFVMGFNGSLIALGAFGVLPPATSAMLHNLSTLGVSLRSMTNLLEPS